MKTTTTIFLTAIILAVLCNAGYSQPVPVWQDSYNAGGLGPVEDSKDMETDEMGNVYVTGTSDSISTNRNIVTIKYRPDGTKAWVRRFDLAGRNDEGMFIELDRSGNVYVIGTGKTSGIPAITHIIVIKYSSDGTLAWSRQLIASGTLGFGYNKPCGAVMHNGTITSNLYIVGSVTLNASRKIPAVFSVSLKAGSYSSVTYIAPVSPIGDSTIRNDTNLRIAKNSLGEIFIAGYPNYRAFVEFWRDVVPTEDFVVKYSSTLTLIWARTNLAYYPNQSFRLQNLAVNKAGNVVISGSIAIGSSQSFTATLRSSTGSTIWSRYSSYYGLFNGGEQMSLDTSDNIIIGGNGNFASGGFIKYNSLGIHQWTRIVNNTGVIYSINTDNSGNVFAACQNDTLRLMMLNGNNGHVAWTYYRGLFPPYLNKVMFGTPDNLYVCGKTAFGTSYNFFTAKLRVTPISGRPIEEIGGKYFFKLQNNYPNPFNPSTSIKFSVPSDGLVTLKVFDVTGKEITKLVDGNIEQGEHEVIFNATHLASGVYFYKLTSGSFTEVKKMVLVK